MTYDPVERHLAVERLVTRESPEGQEKKYYRVRAARWYGGCVTADAVGCGLSCKFCWVSDALLYHPNKVGRFYTAEEIAEALTTVARRRRLKQLRVSSGEPTIGKPHLLQLLNHLHGSGFNFIVETNGIPIGYDEDYASDLTPHKFIHVRVSLKGCSEEEFQLLTGAKPEGFKLQLKALRNLKSAGVSCHPSVMASFSEKGSLRRLAERLSEISPDLAEELEVEELILYPPVVRRIRRAGLQYTVAHAPDRVPPTQV